MTTSGRSTPNLVVSSPAYGSLTVTTRSAAWAQPRSSRARIAFGGPRSRARLAAAM